jgi:hypothetical protein
MELRTVPMEGIGPIRITRRGTSSGWTPPRYPISGLGLISGGKGWAVHRARSGDGRRGPPSGPGRRARPPRPRSPGRARPSMARFDIQGDSRHAHPAPSPGEIRLAAPSRRRSPPGVPSQSRSSRWPGGDAGPLDPVTGRAVERRRGPESPGPWRPSYGREDVRCLTRMRSHTGGWTNSRVTPTWRGSVRIDRRSHLGDLGPAPAFGGSATDTVGRGHGS